VTIIVGSGSSSLTTNATNVRLFTGVGLEMISQIVAPGELLVTMRTLIVSVSTVLCNMPLPVTLHCELKATLIANKWFDALVRSHVLLQEGLYEVGLVAELTLEGPLPGVLVLPHVVVKIAFGYKFFFANFTTVGFLSLVLDPDVLVDRSLVEYLRAYGTPCIVVCFLAFWHEVTLMFHPDSLVRLLE